jgi:putative transposase
MVRFRRNYVPAGTYFFTLTLRDRRSRALTDHIHLLRTAFRDVRQDHPFEIAAIAVLPEHLHAVLTPPDEDADYSGRWRRIKARFSQSLVHAGVPVQKDPRGEYRLWRRRFWEHTIRDERDLETHVAYIHYNPVKHGWVTRAVDWPYSSFHRYLRLGWVDDSWAVEPSGFEGRAYGEPNGL